MQPLREGESVAPGYEVIEHLKRTRLIDVYDVWSEERDSRCVAKRLRPERADALAARRALVREGRLLAEFTHPHIVRAYETVRRPRPVVILETLSGATLAHMIEARRLPTADLVHLGIQLCSAMHYLHGRGLLHLDLKPSNIVSAGGQAKVLDLSIARAPGRGRPGVGTRQYMAPEQVRGGRLGEWTDVWGIGAVLFEAATRVRPFGDDGAVGSARRAGPVGERRRLPRALATVIDASLAPEPRARPSVRSLSEALDALA
jgi:serine/threonine protein kinase